MGNKLLIRAYNVEVGDCFYLRIPDGDRDFSVLIDCGTVGKTAKLEQALQHLEQDLPVGANGRKRLDLVVVSHEHADHIRGFDPANFANIEIGAIWLSAAMDENHPQAEKTKAIHALATDQFRRIGTQRTTLGLALSELAALYELTNDEALEALKVTLPNQNGIKPRYVDTQTPKSELDLGLKEIKIHVLGPERDIDRYYLGAEADTDLRGFSDGKKEFNKFATGTRKGNAKTKARPQNISARDFHKLRSRFVSTTFAFAELASRVKNNASLALLIEWRSRRLLFIGDAEWESRFREGRHNGGWNVMWKERRALLDKPIDFLKVGHHGSTNSTPWNPKPNGKSTEPSRILDAILPLPKRGKKPVAQALASTMRKNYKTIPKAALLVEIGKRIGNAQRYMTKLRKAGRDLEELRHFEELEKTWLDRPQPRRTDLEALVSGVDFVEVEIEGK